jgi:hypothetical protein
MTSVACRPQTWGTKLPFSSFRQVSFPTLCSPCIPLRLLGFPLHSDQDAGFYTGEPQGHSDDSMKITGPAPKALTTEYSPCETGLLAVGLHRGGRHGVQGPLLRAPPSHSAGNPRDGAVGMHLTIVAKEGGPTAQWKGIDHVHSAHQPPTGCPLQPQKADIKGLA